MSKNILFFLLITLCITQNILGICKQSSSRKKSNLKPRMSNNIPYYVDDIQLLPVVYFATLNLNHFVCINFTRQTTKISDRGINYFLSLNKSDIILHKNLSKPTDIYLTKKNYQGSSWLTSFFTGLALGLVSEITRYDRDKYIKIQDKNIDTLFKKYYKKQKQNTNYFSSFDYGSVMLPKSDFGSSKGKRTYSYKLYPHYESIINKVALFSYSDYKRLNEMYCNRKCPKLNECNNRGFPLNDCKRCHCSFYFYGNECELILPNRSPTCGTKQIFKAYSKKLFLNRKNIRGTCSYIIKSSNKKKVAITIKRLNLKNEDNCRPDNSLLIYYRSDWSVSPLYLCRNTTDLKLPPLHKEVFIVFSNYDVKNEVSIKYHTTQ